MAGWFCLIVGIWTVRGLPWQLEDFDQAKQAYTSYEMINRGAWWYQHTPRQKIATKPPLAGWISAAIYQGTHSWNVAWRLPSLLAACGILALLWQCGRQVAGIPGAFLATAAFAWNVLTPRLATLVRTDMLLSALIFAAGWLIWRRLRQSTAWAWRDTLWLTLLLAAATLTKGPIYHAFLLPGLLFWLWLSQPAPEKKSIGLGYLTASLISVIPFLVWTWLRIRQDPAFYDQVVVREFLGRFTVGENAVHNNQTWYFYFPHLLAKTLPWGVLLIAGLSVKSVRRHLRENPAALWLVCWTFGGLLAMTLVPSKRVDRIFPILPPAALCLVSLLPPLRDRRWFSRRSLFLLGSLAVAGYSAFAAVSAWQGYRKGSHRLVIFGKSVQTLCTANHWRYALIAGRDEALLLYADQWKFKSLPSIGNALREGSLQAAVVDSENVSKLAAISGPLRSILEVPHPSRKNYSYLLVRRREASGLSQVRLRGHSLGRGHNPLTCPYCSVKPREF